MYSLLQSCIIPYLTDLKGQLSHKNILRNKFPTEDSEKMHLYRNCSTGSNKRRLSRNALGRTLVGGFCLLMAIPLNTHRKL